MAEPLSFALAGTHTRVCAWVWDCMFRHCAEFLLFAVRGKAPTLRKDQLGVLFAAQGRHSEKPLHAYEMIERLSPKPRLELFARGPRAGYEVWGDQADGNQIPQDTGNLFS